MKAYKKKYEFAWAGDYAIFKLNRVLNLGESGYIIGKRSTHFFGLWETWDDIEVGNMETLGKAIRLLRGIAIAEVSENITIIQN